MMKNASSANKAKLSRLKISMAIVSVALILIILFLLWYFCYPIGVSFKHNEDNYVKIYQSEYLSPGGNEKTDQLKTLYAAVKARTPAITPCPEKDPYPDDERIKAIFFEGEECKGDPARVFAYIGFPEGASEDSPVPGMVLVHGGGCHAWASWVKYWVDHGYAAISMDCFAQVYSGPDHTTNDDPIYWPVDPLSHIPMENFVSKDKPLTEQWFYYFISDIILSNNILRADKRVVADKIGLTGISWGGFASSVAICYDERFAFATPVYGSGFQDVSKTVYGEVFRGDGISDVWDAKNLLCEVQIPVMWFNSNFDPFFSAESTSASAAATKNGAVTFVPDYLHGMTEGIEEAEILRFANEQTGKGVGNIKLDALSFNENKAIVSFTLPEDAKNAVAYVYYRSGPLEYDGPDLKEEWKMKRGFVMGSNASISIPNDAQMFYVLIKADTGSLFKKAPIYATSGIFTRDVLNK